jgi:chitodextrinase
VTPSAPTDLNATPGNGQVDLSWSAPTSNGGAEIDYYVVYQNGTDVRHESGTSTVISGLQNGVSYSFTVAAHNSAGTGSQSGPVSVTPSSQIMVPGSPTALAGQPGNGQVQLRWSAPADDGGADIDYYVVYQNGSDVAHVTGTERTVTGLANGVAYDFAVAAHNSAGTGPVSEAVRVTPDASITVPGIPTGLNYTVSGDQVLLSWDAPDGIGGLNITGYRLYRGTTLATLVEIASVEGRTFLDTNVTNGQTYFYRVSAVNAVGEGDLSSEIGVTVRSSTTGATSFLDTTEGQWRSQPSC